MSWPLRQMPTSRVGTTRVPASTSLGAATVTAHATPHTKGAWVELIAATSGPGTMVIVHVYGSFLSTAATSMLLDIGVGTAGNEKVLIPDLGVGYTTGSTTVPGRQWTFPVFVPAGVRIAARCQALITVDTVSVAIDVFGGGGPNGNESFGVVTAYGVSAATSNGTAIPAAGTAHVKGAWTALVASTTEDILAIAVAAQGNVSAATNGRLHLLDVGSGAAAAEVVAVADLFYADATNEIVYDFLPMNVMLLATPIPAGARLVARRQCSAASDANSDLIVYGMR